MLARHIAAIVVFAAIANVNTPANAQDAIKIGFVAEFSGMFADLGRKVNEGVKLFVKTHGDRIAGKKIEIINKDVGGPLPDVAKRLSQELVARDNVDILAGYIATPSALASVPIATQAKKPMLLVQAATSGITERSPYVARLSYTLAQVAAPLGTWATENGIKTVFSLVADYGPGYDAEAAFTKAFTAGGGQVIGSARIPLASLEMGPFVQRAHDAKPDAVFAFVPAGVMGIAFMKTFAERGLAAAGIKLITTGDVVSDNVLEAVGDSALGVISSHHYSVAHDSPENHAFVKAWQDMYGANTRPDFIGMQAFDTMATIYEIGKRQNGVIDADKFMTDLKDFKLASPRGPIAIDGKTRNVIQTIYIRRVEKRDGQLYNIEFDKSAGVSSTPN
ncbi:MAG: ABC transporter substrate-binding protein [Acetobacteraceae bacterium]